jgi:hypothetical protein
MSHSEPSQQMLVWEDKSGSIGRSTAHAAGGPRSAGERHHPLDGGAHLARLRMLTP